MTNNKINKPEHNEVNTMKKKGGFSSWWKNLGKGGRIALCVLTGAGVTTAAVVPTVIAMNKNNKSIVTSHKAVLKEGSIKDGVSIKDQKNLSNGDLEVTLSCPENKFVLNAFITISYGALKADEYTISKNVITMKSAGLQRYNSEEVKIETVLAPRMIKFDKTEINMQVGETATLKITSNDGVTVQEGTLEGIEDAALKGIIKILDPIDENTISFEALNEGDFNIVAKAPNYMPAGCTVTIASKPQASIAYIDGSELLASLEAKGVGTPSVVTEDVKVDEPNITFNYDNLLSDLTITIGVFNSKDELIQQDDVTFDRHIQEEESEPGFAWFTFTSFDKVTDLKDEGGSYSGIIYLKDITK